jgi:hypothetical protein
MKDKQSVFVLANAVKAESNCGYPGLAQDANTPTLRA